MTRTWALPVVLMLVLLAAACRSAPTEGGGVLYEVDGNEAVSTTALLRSAIRELDDFAERGLRAADAADAAFAMERLLRREGHSAARVRFDLLPSEETPERLVFRVEEGPRTLIRETLYPGAESVREERLRSMLAARFALPWRGARPYRETQVDEAVSSIESMYLLDGYYDVRVGPAELAFTEDRTEVDITIPVHEGARYRINRIPLDPELPEEMRKELRKSLPPAGSPFHVRIAAEAASITLAWLRENGYQIGTVRGEYQFVEGTTSVDVTLTIELGRQSKLDDLTITGLERTDADFAYERLKLERGALLRQSDVNDAIDALYGTGVFRTVDVEAIPDEDADEPYPVDVELRVEENEARSFEFGGGWGSYERARGWIGYRDRNFMSVARLLEITAYGSLKSEGIETRVTDRYLLGKNRTLSASARLESREEPSYDTDSLHLDLSVLQPLGPQHSVRYGYQVRFDDTSDLDGRIRGVDEGRSRAAGFYGTVHHDTRDDRLFPTRGEQAEFGMFWSDEDVGGDLDFLETKATLSLYFPIAHQMVLALGGRFTTRDVLNDDKSLPIQERLFLGGENTIRSYQQDELGPTDQFNDPQGGLTSAMASVELRRRIVGDLDGALFYEVGVVSPDSWDLDAPAGGAIGTGLRYRLPIGPIRVDFAYNPMHRFAAKRKWEIHLSFGFSF